MKLHRFIITPTSAWGTPLRSDTLYGLLLYHLAESDGDDMCRDTINLFKQGNAPFIVSSLMPENQLFFPKLPPVPRASFHTWVKQEDFKNAKGDALNIYDALKVYKKFRKQTFLSLSVWKKHAHALSVKELFAEFCPLATPKKVKEPSKDFDEAHVSISRASNTALQGKLFFNKLTAFASDTRFHLYARTEEVDKLLAKLEHIGNTGFGKDASTGKGRFTVTIDTSFQASDVEIPISDNDTRHHLLLSVCAAPDMSAMKGYYAFDVKRGKAAPLMANPFKNPLLLVQEGSLLSHLPSGPYVLENIHIDSRIVQITEPLTLPCSLGARPSCASEN